MKSYSKPPHVPVEMLPHLKGKVFDPDLVAADLTIATLKDSRYYNMTATELTLEERKQLGCRMLSEATQDLTWQPGNGVLICGQPGAGKTTLAQELQKQLPYMRYAPTSSYFNKNYTVNFQNPPQEGTLTFYEQLLTEYAFARVRQAVKMHKQLSESKKKLTLSADHIVVGGIIPSIVTLCAYTKTHTVDEKTGELIIPEVLTNLLLLLLRQWAPRAIVFMDAPVDERIERAKAQSMDNPEEWNKRVLPFQYDRILRELTISTIRRIGSSAQNKNIPCHLLYFPTSSNSPQEIEGLERITSTNELAKTIYASQNHQVLLMYQQRIEQTFG